MFKNEGGCNIAVVILTFNEAKHLARCIASVRGIASDIVVIDSFSTDETLAIAEAEGARVLQHPFVNQSSQFQWGLDNAGIVSQWILKLDADEIIEPDLEREILRRLPTIEADVAGVTFDRKHMFMGRWVRHGGRYPLRLVRLWRRGRGRVENRWMDEHIVVWGGRTVHFPGGFLDQNENDLTFFTAKHNSYATREAIDVLSQKYKLTSDEKLLNAESSSHQASRKRWIKQNIYNKLPLWAGPLLYFIYRYFIQLGFLDGRTGTIYHILQGFWYRYLVSCKIYEFDRQLRDCRSKDERVARLSNMTGYDLSQTDVGR